MNQSRGFGILEVIVALGLASLVGLALSEGLKSSFKLVKTIQTNQQGADVTNLVKLALANSNVCKQAFRNTSDAIIGYDGSSTNGSDSNKAIYKLVYLTGQEITRTNVVYQGIRLKKIFLQNESESFDVRRADNLNYKQRATQLILEFQVESDAFGAKTKTYSIPLSIVTGPETSSEIVDCATIDNSEVSCVSLGGTFDRSQNPPCLMTKFGVSDGFADRDANTPTYGLYAKGDIKGGGNLSVSNAVSAKDVNVSNSLDVANSVKSGTLSVQGPAEVSGVLTAQSRMAMNYKVTGVDSGVTVVNKEYLENSFKNKGVCPSGQVVKGFDGASGDVVCGTPDALLAGACPAGTYQVGFTPAGEKVCQNLSSIGACGPGEAMVGVDSNGTRLCQKVGALLGVNCGSGQYLQGITSAGAAICGTVPGATPAPPPPAPAPAPAPSPVVSTSCTQIQEGNTSKTYSNGEVWTYTCEITSPTPRAICQTSDFSASDYTSWYSSGNRFAMDSRLAYILKSQTKTTYKFICVSGAISQLDKTSETINYPEPTKVTRNTWNVVSSYASCAFDVGADCLPGASSYSEPKNRVSSVAACNSGVCMGAEYISGGKVTSKSPCTCNATYDFYGCPTGKSFVLSPKQGYIRGSNNTFGYCQ